MPTKGKVQNLKFHVPLAFLLAGGLVWAELGQRAWTLQHGTPDPCQRYVFAIVPYLLIAFGQCVLARSRADFTILLVCSVPVILSNALLFDKPDELGLIPWVVPIEGIVLVIASLALVVIRILVAGWLRRRRVAMQAAPTLQRARADRAP